MALTRIRTNSVAAILRQILQGITLVRHNASYNNKEGVSNVSIEIDALDDFTTQLMQKKTIKWGNYKLKSGILSKIDVDNNVEERNIKTMDINEINHLFQKHIDNCNSKAILDLMRICIKHKQPPKTTILFHVINIASLMGDKEMIVQLQDLYKHNHSLIEANSNFNAFMAQAIWVRGNISKALEIFKDIYKNNVYIRRRVRLMFKYLVVNIINKHSEAVLINIIKFSESILEESKDVYFLVHVWQTCFLSEWYADQCLAVDLLEKHSILCNQITHHIPSVVNTALRNHQTEIVYRLLEILLRYNLQEQLPGIIIPLFHYQVNKGDLRSCNEIIEWSIKNKIEIPFIAKKPSTKTDDYQLKF